MNKQADAAFLSTSSILLFIYTILEIAFSLAFSQPAYYSGLQNGPGGRNLQQQKRNVTRMISLILAEKIFSLFLIMFMGYAVVHWGLLHAEDSKTLSLISLYLISPCVIISAFQVQYTPDVLHGLLLALAAAVLLHVGIIVVVNLLGHALHLDAVEKASMIYSNAGNLIIPIVTAVLGKEWVIYSSAFLSVQLFLLWSHAKSMLCGEKSFALKKVLTNINMIAILAGAALFLLHIQLPAVIEDSLDMVGSAIGPISMIILGMLMAGMNFKKILGYRRLWLVTALRLGGIALDDRTKEVTLDGDPVSLTPREYDILHLLMGSPGTVFSPKRIYRAVWGEEPFGVENAVAVHIRHLREKLEIDPSDPRYIKVVWGQGYKMEGGKP